MSSGGVTTGDHSRQEEQKYYIKFLNLTLIGFPDLLPNPVFYSPLVMEELDVRVRRDYKREGK